MFRGFFFDSPNPANWGNLVVKIVLNLLPPKAERWRGCMKKIEINTICKKLLADVYTPVGIYLRLRDRFRDTILLESTDHHAAENSWSFICINAIGGIEITSTESIEFKLPAHSPEKVDIKNI